MRCYLIRHGKDDDTIRGGWSQAPLTSDGITEVESLSEWIANHCEQYAIKHIYSSDLCRAVQTAQILTNIIQLPVSLHPLPYPQLPNSFQDTYKCNVHTVSIRDDRKKSCIDRIFCILHLYTLIVALV